MATAQMNTVIRHLRRAALLQDGADRTDGELLASFIDEKDEAAFETLVRRHGSMVLNVCNRIVRNHHDAEDAFQATFLVLAHKASSVRPRTMVANWLHGVACRTAMKAKTMTAKRRVRESNVTEMPELEAAPQDQWDDLQPIIDLELSGLPENYRLPIILCDLEGKSIKEATQQLGWPQGTLAGRLARARKLLAKRLTHRGVVLSGGALAVVLGEKAASACVPVALAISTTKAAVAVTAGQAAAPSLVSAKVATLMEGVIKGMLLTKLKTFMVAVLAICMVAFGGGLLTHNMAAGQQNQPPEGAARNAQSPDERSKGKPAPATKPPPSSNPRGVDLDFKRNELQTVVLENSKLYIEPGTKVRLTPVKTAKGNGVRLEWPGVVVEALRMKIETNTQTVTIEGADGEMFNVMYLQKGPAKVGEIIVLGNTKTPNEAIRKKLQLAPGDVLDDKTLQSAEERLATFKAAITVIDNADNPGVKDILVRLKEK